MTARPTRRQFMTAAGAGVVLAGCGGGDREPPRGREDGAAAAGDLTILSFALTLEYLAADFYERLLDEQVLQDADSDVATQLREDEGEHIDALQTLIAELGGRRPARSRPVLDNLLRGTPEAILARAATLEDLGSAAYLGQIPHVQDDDVLATVLAIHSVEGRHAAALNHLVGRPFAPDGALARPLDADQVRARIAGITS